MSDNVSTFGPSPEQERTKSSSKGFFRILANAFGLFAILFIIFGIALGPVGTPPRSIYQNQWMQQGRQIGQMMFAYATDNIQNGNAYPDGNSSTEVFQKLLDGNYCSDPSVFYLPLAGKTPAVAGQKLKPENVCWDVTSGVDSSASDVPLVFMTGYKVTYVPGGSAVPLIKPYPRYYTPSFWDWLGSLYFADWYTPRPGMAVFYKSYNAKFMMLDHIVNSDGTTTFPLKYKPGASIENFVPNDFQPDGHTYRQLTPDGPLPP